MGACAIEPPSRLRTGGGEYDQIRSRARLAELLTDRLQAVSHDKHLLVVYHSEPRPLQEAGSQDPSRHEEDRQWSTLHNCGFQKVERLPGNVGYLDLRAFHDPQFAAETAVAAMTWLAHTDALIIDLRDNDGGEPAMIALITSYLFDELVHLNSLYWRESDSTQQFWTLPYVPGTRYGGQKPVYVLTSAATFSGGEEFSYNLKQLKRATIVGETTGGGAHPGGVFQLDEHLEVFIPTGRAINPISGTNWEGTGVIPDIAVPAADALTVGQILALKQVIARIGDTPTGPRKALLEEARTRLAALEEEDKG